MPRLWQGSPLIGLITQLLVAPTTAMGFDFAAINCGHDDPHDDSARADHSGFMAKFARAEVTLAHIKT